MALKAVPRTRPGGYIEAVGVINTSIVPPNKIADTNLFNTTMPSNVNYMTAGSNAPDYIAPKGSGLTTYRKSQNG
jgi:hypothetical protein